MTSKVRATGADGRGRGSSRSPDAVLLRRCIACRQLYPRDQLVRVVRAPDGCVRLNGSRKPSPGRGAYVCRSGNCWREVLRRRSLSKALKVTIPGEFWSDFEALFTP